MKATPVVQAQNLTIGYKKGRKETIKVQEHLSFELYPGELVCLLGPNGAGKSTLLRTLSAFQLPLAGALRFEGKPLSDYSEKERSRKIGVVLTDRTQAGGLTVYELVSLGRQPHTGFFGRLDQNDHKIVKEAILAVGIQNKSNNYIAELSDGERQKAMISKALVQECPVIFLDEPTAFLDVTSRIEIMQLLHTIARQQKKTILLSTHDIEQALILADRLWLLSRTKGLDCGVTEDLIFNDSMDTLFDREKIKFDRNQGTYYPPIRGEHHIIVEAEDSTLKHWATNALNRNHYICLSSHTAPSSHPVLKIKTAQDMTLLLKNKQEIPIHSFADLIESLKLLP
ncbi:ABC transporter ATP-binding protein [uncultured Sanguibacteroides sp.]|uniref:ABC transporter ATP-binding protein n=1 Tax=uncultured Sanguibacteroides sp. TaxID=1635151 RepID=UPI0025F94688|nr:ABC transporter ATP-binding protein [uncultured Sanguibacteroides sp.]